MNDPSISNRECEVLELIIQEYTSKEIALKLFISTETVLSHRKSIMHKLSARNVAGLVRKALEKGLYPLQQAI